MHADVPKPYLRNTRYLLWRQLRNDPRVTVLSPTLYCTVGGYAPCREDASFIAAQNSSFFNTFCRFACKTTMLLGGSEKRVHTSCLGASEHSPVHALRQTFRRACAAYRDVNFSDELADMRRDTRRLSHAQYLALAMRHRFCLVAPGDFVSTHKASEAMAIGGVGGCVPVFVLPSIPHSDMTRTVDVANYLPYAHTWLDYCDSAYFVSEQYARHEAGRHILERLARITDAELDEKRARLREVHAAFAFREPHPSANASGGDKMLSQPSAADFILGEMCSAAYRHRSRQQQQVEQEPFRSPAAASRDHGRCVLFGGDSRSATGEQGSVP